MTSLMLSLVIYSAVIFHVTIDGTNIVLEIVE